MFMLGTPLGPKVRFCHRLQIQREFPGSPALIDFSPRIFGIRIAMRLCGVDHHEARDQGLASGPRKSEYQTMVVAVDEA
ncbi:MAG: hypothetical protein IT495_21700 [Gammaproteobacteria bacterium]|nr:hypothetical protein [Gammaproteobacteria bacterium]